MVHFGQKLTKRDQEVLELIVRGLTNKAIAKELGLGEGTIKIYAHRLYQRLGVTHRSELLANQGSNSVLNLIISKISLLSAFERQLLADELFQYRNTPDIASGAD